MRAISRHRTFPIMFWCDENRSEAVTKWNIWRNGFLTQKISTWHPNHVKVTGNVKNGRSLSVDHLFYWYCSIGIHVKTSMWTWPLPGYRSSAHEYFTATIITENKGVHGQLEWRQNAFCFNSLDIVHRAQHIFGASSLSINACPRFGTPEKKLGVYFRCRIEKWWHTRKKFQELQLPKKMIKNQTTGRSKTKHPTTVFLIFSRTEVEHPPI
jgi:hypothetical protein